MLAVAEAYDQATRLYADQQFAEAAATVRQGLTGGADDGRLWQIYGAALWALRDFVQATAALETATTLAPLLPVPQRALADCYAQLGKPELAIQIYASLLENRRTPTLLLPILAAALNTLGQQELALQACEVIQERDPTFHQAHFGIAYYRSRLGAPASELVEPLAMAMDLAPEILHYRLNLAFAWADLGRFDDARLVLAPVRIEEVRCPCWLMRMRRIFARSGDQCGVRACLDQLQNLAQTESDKS